MRLPLVIVALSLAAFTVPAAGAGPSESLPTERPSLRLPATPFGEVPLPTGLALAGPAGSLMPASRLGLASGGITAPREPRKSGDRKKPPEEQSGDARADEMGLGPERAQILLRSLTVPGWGQATLGHRGSARAFALIEAGIWTSFVAFRVQESMRTDTYLRTARLSAGIDLADDDDEFRSIVGSFSSSDEYNLLVVTRDAANIYLSDPDNPDFEGYRRYIAENSLGGDMAWRWSDQESFLRYGDQRRFAHKAGLRANTALALAIANRLVSALHAARLAGQEHGRARGWRLEVEPGLAEPGRYRAALTTNF